MTAISMSILELEKLRPEEDISDLWVQPQFCHCQDDAVTVPVQDTKTWKKKKKKEIEFQICILIQHRRNKSNIEKHPNPPKSMNYILGL